MRYILTLMFIPVLFVGGCNTPTSEPINLGAPPAELKKAADNQHEALTSIRNHTTKILSTTNEEPTKENAKSILVSLPDAEYGNKVLAHEADDKVVVVNHVHEIETKLQHYEQEDNKFMNRMLLLLKIAGGILIPIGLFLMTRGVLLAIWISILGVFAIILSTIIQYIESNGIWIAAAITSVALIPILKTFFSQNKALGEAVKVAETLKRELLHHAPDVIQDLFGKEHTPGKIVQDPTTKKIIRAQRKLVAKEWAPIVPISETDKIPNKKTTAKKSVKKVQP